MSCIYQIGLLIFGPHILFRKEFLLRSVAQIRRHKESDGVANIYPLYRGIFTSTHSSRAIRLTRRFTCVSIRAYYFLQTMPSRLLQRQSLATPSLSPPPLPLHEYG